MELEEGKPVSGIFIIEKILTSKESANVSLKKDDGFCIIGIIKDNVELFLKNFSVGDSIFCKGIVQKKRKNQYIHIVYVTKNKVDPVQSFVKVDLEKLITKFNLIVLSVQDQDYKKILNCCFNEDIKQLFFSYPAAKNHHHNYLYGLLEHSLEVVDVCTFLCDYYKDLNKDLLICAGLLHDIGKLKTYDVEDMKIEKNIWEGLVGHLVCSSFFITKLVSDEIEIDTNKLLLLHHLILSHHGQFGSAIEIKTREAHILHMSDMISSTMNFTRRASYNASGWTEDKKWFLGSINAERI